MSKFSHSSVVPCPPETVFDWHARPGAFTRLTPPWEAVEVLNYQGLREGSTLTLSVPLMGPVSSKWRVRHSWCERPKGFTDVQETGPFASWKHEHRFEAVPEGTQISDQIHWEAPFSSGGLADPLVIRPRLEQMFRWRHRRLQRDLQRHADADLAPMRVAITGASGLVGKQLSTFLTTGGHTVVPLTRYRDRPGIFWDPTGGEVGPGLEDCDAVVHLAGAGIAEHPWTDDYKKIILESRVLGTQTLCRALAKLPPKILVSTSAVGLYGNRGDTVLHESSAPGDGFLAEVCSQWEGATLEAREAGWRVATVRVGLVLSARGGLLGPLLPLFKMGGGGPIGGGDQWMSWVHVDDLVALFHFLIAHPLEGPFNGVAPHPVDNRTFSNRLGAALSRPAVLPAPAFGVRLALGREKADALVLASQRVSPSAAQNAGFRFDEPQIEGAFEFELG